jgi:cell fate regulator YaaT (PSP1 superfamily)
MSRSVLVRYGMIAEVARFTSAACVPLGRGERVVVRSHRGVEVGTLLEDVPPVGNGDEVQGDSQDTGGQAASATPLEANATEPTDLQILRVATAEDERTVGTLKGECEGVFHTWRRRIDEWNLQLELIDLEWTLDKSKLILYVLNDRGPESTKLALQAAAAGLGTIEVQPVGPDGPVVVSQGGGCGSGHCGSGEGSSGCCS